MFNIYLNVLLWNTWSFIEMQRSSFSVISEERGTSVPERVGQAQTGSGISSGSSFHLLGYWASNGQWLACLPWNRWLILCHASPAVDRSLSPSPLTAPTLPLFSIVCVSHPWSGPGPFRQLDIVVLMERPYCTPRTLHCTGTSLLQPKGYLMIYPATGLWKYSLLFQLWHNSVCVSFPDACVLIPSPFPLRAELSGVL